MAEWGTIAASCGREPIAGSGVLPGGELASGDVTVLGFSCGHTATHRNQVVLLVRRTRTRASSLQCSLMMLIDLLTSRAKAVTVCAAQSNWTLVISVSVAQNRRAAWP